MTPELLLAPVALLVGLALGLLLGRVHLRAYREGVEDAHRRALESERARGGPCWVRGQVERQDPPL